MFSQVFYIRSQIIISLNLFKGPNFLWHCDGYNKLKPYGLPIHGCLDGYLMHDGYYYDKVYRYSRKIIWLQVANSMSDPSYIAYYYLNAIENIGGKTICIYYFYVAHACRMSPIYEI